MDKEMNFNLKIIILFLEKLEKLSEDERETMLRIIKWFSTPKFVI